MKEFNEEIDRFIYMKCKSILYEEELKDLNNRNRLSELKKQFESSSIICESLLDEINQMMSSINIDDFEEVLNRLNNLKENAKDENFKFDTPDYYKYKAYCFLINHFENCLSPIKHT